MKRDRLFTMKATADELAAWKALAKSYHVTLAELIRGLLAGQPPAPNRRAVRHRPPPKVDPDLIRQVAAIGNNLNQIARRCNRGDRFEVLAELASIERELAELLELAKEGKLAH